MADPPKRKRATLAERRALRDERRRGWRTQDAVATGGYKWCSKHARTMFVGVNVAFGVLGVVLVAMGIYGTQTTWAEFFGKGPGYSVIALGFAVIFTAVAGIVGERYDNKCLLLLYFIVLSASFLVLIIMGAIATFDKGTINDKFSSWWDKYPDAAAKGQKDFNCCGYEDMSDRPVGDCAVEVPDATKGCKEVGLDYMRSRFVPLFMCAFIFGCCQLLAMIVSMRLVCRSTMKRKAPAQGLAEAQEWNSYQPGSAIEMKGTPLPTSQDAPPPVASNTPAPTQLVVAGSDYPSTV